MNKIKFIASYDCDQQENRTYVLAATNKIDYICSVLNLFDNQVEIISVARTKNNNFYRGKSKRLPGNNLLRLLPTVPGGNTLFKRISLIFTQIHLFIYLVLHTSCGEKILVYHGLAYGNAVFWAKKIKKFKMILEVEEIYQNVQNLGFIKNKREYRDFRLADGYIFPTKLLNNLINVEQKPYTIIHGTYHVEPNRNVSFQDNKIHVVYAGTFDSQKGGAAAAISAAKWLPENYHVHILGFGSAQEIQKIKDLVMEISLEAKATVSYNGLLAGEAYIQFIQKCHIGLSTQNPDASFNDTSFPSKILSYMANGLRVVTVRIPAIETSAIGKDVYYYEEQTPEKIAEAILKIDFHDAYDGRKKIAVLDQQFCQDLKKLIHE